MEVDYGLWQENGLNLPFQYWIVVSRRSHDYQLLLPYVQRDSVHVAPGHLSRLPLVSVWTEKIVSYDLFLSYLVTAPTTTLTLHSIHMNFITLNTFHWFPLFKIVDFKR